MVWVSGTLLGLAGLALALSARPNRGGDAAGRGLATAYLAFATTAWLILAGLFGLGVWLNVWFLKALPTLFAALPPCLALLAGLWALGRRWISRMPSTPLKAVDAAARAGQGARVKLLLEGVPIPDLPTGRALLRAALKGKYARDAVDALLAAGADPRDPELLAMALESRHTDVLPFVKHGADPNTILPSGDSLAFAALVQGQMHIVEALVKAGADPNQKDRDGWPLLLAHAAGRRGFSPGNWIFVRKLIDLGADPKAPGPDGSTVAQHFAKAVGVHPEHVDALRARLAL
jgi:ankyrin repeat protein